MSSNIQELEPRVAKLEATLEKLIENLADNNAKFIEALFAIAHGDKNKQDAVKKCEGGICPNDPPKCKKKDKDKDKNED